jgi:diketogulonate reductase-like aldo/keto reductase
MRTVRLPSGREVPALGQGTWMMGEGRARRHDELAALRLGLDLGMRLIDTAEMYGDGAAEQLVGEAIEGRRDEVVLVSKVLPEHATTRQGVLEACGRSLERLKTDRLDLYLLHWMDDGVRLDEVFKAFQQLQRESRVLEYGVSNFDLHNLDRAAALPGSAALATNQVLYNLSHRGIEWDVLPWCRSRGLPIMAYSPIHQGALAAHPRLRAVADRHGATAAQVALAWTLREPGVLTIPKAATAAHVRQNRAALDLALTPQDLAELDEAFPPPRRKIPLETT